jgi:hypothetical protein
MAAGAWRRALTPWGAARMLPPCEYGGRCIFLENFGSSIYFSKIKEKIYEKIPSWQCSQAEQTLPIGLSVVRTHSRTMDAAPHESRDTNKRLYDVPKSTASGCPLPVVVDGTDTCRLSTSLAILAAL